MQVRGGDRRLEVLKHHLSGDDKAPSDLYERIVYDVMDEGPVPGTSFGKVILSEHAQYRMDQKGVRVPDIRHVLREFQKEWTKERNRGGGPLTRAMQQPSEFDYSAGGIRVFMRPLKFWKPGNKIDVWIRTVYPIEGRPPRPVPPNECKTWQGWSQEYPEGFDRLFKSADLMPPLGYPGGACHTMERVHDNIRSPRLMDELVDKIEMGESLSNSEASKIYGGPEAEKGLDRLIKTISITPHAQYRMDQRGITVTEVRLALAGFVKSFYDEKSKGSVLFKEWQTDLHWSKPIKWTATSPRDLTVVFSLVGSRADIVTVYWKGQKDPKPTQEESCGYPSSGRVAGATGDCYEANGKWFMENSLLGGKDMVLVHGEVTGQGPLDGVKYGHAWVEDGDTVIDVSNGKNLRIPKVLYYALGNIEDNVHKYKSSDFRRKIMKYGHWGPWDLRTSTGL